MSQKINSPLVSVVIPAYNAEKFIAESIESIINQTYQNIEVIIINDASTDNTLSIINSYAMNDERIKVYNNENNLGIGANRTKGIKLSAGQYVCWQDADDVSLPHRIEKQVTYMETQSDVGVTGGFIRFFDESGDGPVRNYAEYDNELRNAIFKYNPIAQPASMVRRDVYEKVGFFNEAYKVSEDLEMLFRIGEYYKFANVQDVILRYRQSATSLTRANLRQMEMVTLNLRRQYMHNPAYSFKFADALFNIAQFASLWLMPIGLRIWLFRVVRGDK